MNPKRYYNQHHAYYCGVDLHARSLFVCILDPRGNTQLSKNLPASPDAFLDAIAPFREDLVVGVECMFAWYSKSLLSSVLFPVWMQVRDPSTRIITATYSKDLTVCDAIRSRQLIESQWFAARFPNLLVLTEDQSRKDYYANTSKGHRLSAGIGARTQGFDADLIVCDDLMNLATGLITRGHTRTTHRLSSSTTEVTVYPSQSASTPPNTARTRHRLKSISP